MNYSLGVIEARFADIVWENAPLTTATLVKLSEQKLNWKRTTTYTVLKRLCERGIFSMKNSIVTVCVPRNIFYANQSNEYIDENFSGSLPAFLSAFAAKKRLTAQEIDEIQALIDAFKEGE